MTTAVRRWIGPRTVRRTRTDHRGHVHPAGAHRVTGSPAAPRKSPRQSAQHCAIKAFELRRSADHSRRHDMSSLIEDLARDRIRQIQRDVERTRQIRRAKAIRKAR